PARPIRNDELDGAIGERALRQALSVECERGEREDGGPADCRWRHDALLNSRLLTWSRGAIYHDAARVDLAVGLGYSGDTHTRTRLEFALVGVDVSCDQGVGANDHILLASLS